MSTNNTWISRALTARLKTAISQFPSVMVSGARQVGKTALCRHVWPDANYVTLDLPAKAEAAQLNPEAFLKRNKPPLIIDEVQYAPELLRYLKVHSGCRVSALPLWFSDVGGCGKQCGMGCHLGKHRDRRVPKSIGEQCQTAAVVLLANREWRRARSAGRAWTPANRSVRDQGGGTTGEKQHEGLQFFLTPVRRRYSGGTSRDLSDSNRISTGSERHAGHSAVQRCPLAAKLKTEPA